MLTMYNHNASLDLSKYTVQFEMLQSNSWNIICVLFIHYESFHTISVVCPSVV